MSDKELRPAQFQALWVDRQAGMAVKTGAHEVIKEREFVLALVKNDADDVVHIGSAVHFLKCNGLESLVQRFRKVSKCRNMGAHQDATFLKDLECGLQRLPLRGNGENDDVKDADAHKGGADGMGKS